jgi:hypothetical protein
MVICVWRSSGTPLLSSKFHPQRLTYCNCGEHANLLKTASTVRWRAIMCCCGMHACSSTPLAELTQQIELPVDVFFFIKKPCNLKPARDNNDYLLNRRGSTCCIQQRFFLKKKNY